MNAIFDLMGNILYSIIKGLPAAAVALPIIFAAQRNGRMRRSAWHSIGLVAFIVYMYAMLDLTIISRLSLDLLRHGPAVRTLSPIPFDGIVTMATTEYVGVSYNVFIRNVLGNIIMFLPLGFFLPLLWTNLRSAGKVIAICALASFAIEFTQYWIGGIADIDDLMLNTAGAALGYASYALSSRIVPAIQHRLSPGRGLYTAR